MLRILHLPTERLSRKFGTAMAPPLTPLWSKIRNDPAGPNHCFLGEGEVFVVTSAFKSVTLKIDMVTSIFFNIFVQDCRRIKEDCFLLSGIFIVGKIKGGRNS